tara:strand:- start:5129 stop:5305 length:177 start_codon:yes stop_codon:yes gene_type:complete
VKQLVRNNLEYGTVDVPSAGQDFCIGSEFREKGLSPTLPCRGGISQEFSFTDTAIFQN